MFIFAGGVPTVVQEGLSGVISDKKIALNGISYTFIQKGEETGYLLDNYELVLSDDGSTMRGRNIDTDGTHDLVYKRFSEGVSPK